MTLAQQGTYPRRGGAKLSGTCIVHTSEGRWANGVAALTTLIHNRADYGSYHRACDWADVEIYFPWEWEAWQDTETNNWAVGIAAALATSDWGKMPADVEEGFYSNMARMAADFVVYMREEHLIEVPLRRITGAQARARVPGFAAHGDSGVGRTDPGVNFNWTRFFNYTRELLLALEQPTPAPAQTIEQEVAMKLEDLKNLWSSMTNSADREANWKWIARLVMNERVQDGADPKATTSFREYLQWYKSGLNNLSVKLDTIIRLVTESNTILRDIRALLGDKR